jgi:hypothetical protein
MLRLKAPFNAVVASLMTLAALMLAPAVVRAQGGSDGAITGYVFDQAGNPLAGVQIVAASPTQIGGSKKTYSNSEGLFKLRQLFPGTFQVTATAPKLKTVIQKGVKVGITSAAEVNLVMEVQGAGVEQVQVVQTAPTVSTTTTNVKEVYDLDFVESMPLNSRDQVFNQMVNQIGGAVSGRVRGGAANQTIFTQDGFDMRDQYPVTKASAAYEIQSAGYGADNATASGGIVNLVTKSGSNKWEFEFNATAENDSLRFGDNRDSPGNYYYLVNPAVAGPIVKDKLWFAFAFESHLLGRGRDADAEGVLPTPEPSQKGINKGTLKVTWAMTGRNKLTFLSNFDSAFNVNLKDGLGVQPEAQQNRKAGLSGLWGLIWETVLTDELVFRSQAAFSTRPQYWFPSLCKDDPNGTCAFTPGIINKFPRRVESQGVAQGCNGTGECTNGTAVPHRREDLFVLQTFNKLQWFLDGKSLGEHNLVLKHQFYTEKEIRRQAQPGDYFDEYNGTGVPEARTTFYSNDPRTEAPRYGWYIATDIIYRNNASFSDAWRPTRHLTLTPALSYIWTSGQNSAGSTVIDSKAWAPSLAAAWDATHDGRTVIRGSYSQYVDVAIRTPVLHTLGSQVSRKCAWNATTQTYDESNCVYSGGATKNTIGMACGPDGIDANGNSCRTGLDIPRTIEYTFGGEREIVEGVALAVDFVYRRFNNQYETRETNRIWNGAGSAVLGYRNGKAETVLDMGTPDGATRYYRGVTAAINKRQGRARAYLSYTLSQLNGTVYNGADNPWGDIPGRDPYLNGPLPDDRTHDLKFSMTYQASSWLSLGARYNFSSGFLYNRLFKNEVTGAYEDYRARRGVNPGTDLNDPGDDRELRYPPQQEVNIQARVNLQPLLGHQLAFYVDALNVLNLRTVTGYGQNDGTNYGVENGWLAPFRMRLGLDFKY